jgi:hypothetical protein
MQSGRRSEALMVAALAAAITFKLGGIPAPPVTAAATRAAK